MHQLLGTGIKRIAMNELVPPSLNGEDCFGPVTLMGKGKTLLDIAGHMTQQLDISHADVIDGHPITWALSGHSMYSGGSMFCCRNKRSIWPK